MAHFEKINFHYSTKNIPICSQNEYKLKLIDKIRNFCRRIRLKVFYCTNKEENESMYENEEKIETFGFKSKFLPKQEEELKLFESDMFDIVRQLKFRRINNKFQEKIQKDVKTIRNSKQIYVAADKTTNYYKLNKNEYIKLKENSIRKTYKKNNYTVIDSINKEAKQIVKKLKLDKKLINQLPLKDCYVTLKDHKDNFFSKPETRLINPSNSDIGQISKIIVEKVNKAIRKTKEFNQWTSTEEVLKWYKNLEKNKYKLMKFDIKDFYPSITKALLNKAIEFASNYETITEQDKSIIDNAAKSVLVDKEEIWTKQSISEKDNELFDITMGSRHGAEISELVGLYILQGLKQTLPDKIIGIYRDDGLIALDKSTSNVEIEKMKKELHKFAKSIKIKIIIENPAFQINFLDLNLNLKKHSFFPYRKPNNRINYVNANSNHPPAIIKQIPKMIENRLAKNSSSKKLFDSIKKEYNEALKLNGYSHDINYTKITNETTEKKRKRKRKCIWFNPPFCCSVKTNVGNKFLKIIKKHFSKESKLNKYVNSNCIKLSYSCMPNIEMTIKSHNKKLLNKEKITDETCNCRDKNKCPLKGGNCRTENVIYEASVSAKNETKTYIGITANQLKKRISTHNTTINCKPDNRNYNKYVNSTELSKLIHKLKNEGEDYKLNWKILERVNKHQPGKTTCKLCLKEALKILQASNNCINKKSELMGSCRHRNKFLLMNWKQAIS